MKKITSLKSIPVIAIGILLLVSATIFPVLAEKSQVKGMENGAKNLEVNLSKIPDLEMEKNQEQIEVKNVITMTEEEEKIFDELVTLLQKSTLMTSPNNRELSETESNRRTELRKQFLEGTIKGENTLPIGENLKEPYFNPKNETYYYPEIEMTDEQLLQIVDFDEKVNMTFSKFYETYIQKVMDNSDIRISEEEAIKSAIDAIERIYGVELNNMKARCSFSVDEHLDEKRWRLIFEPKNMDVLMEQEKLYWMYFAAVDIYSGKVDYVDSYYSDQTDETKESAETDLNHIDDHKKIAEEVLTNKLNAKNIEFQKAYIRKPISTIPSNKTISFNKSLYLVYKAEDRYVEIEFLYGSKRMVALYFYDDPVKLNERINKVEQQSIGSIKIHQT